MLVINERQVFISTILKYPDLTKEFAIIMDASQVILGAVLTQEYKIEGKKYFMPVLYASRSLKGANRQYCVMDLEALAVVWAVETFRLYVMVTHFKVMTDHNAIKALLNKATLEGRLAC